MHTNCTTYGQTPQEMRKTAVECVAKLRAKGRHGCRAGCHMDTYCPIGADVDPDLDKAKEAQAAGGKVTQ